MRFKDVFLKGISYIFHPLIMPLLGVLFYFSKTPRFIPEPIRNAKIFSVIILTIALPILFYFLLKTINKVQTIDLKTTKERVLPLIVNAIIVFLILLRVFTINEIEELYFFFLGILCSNIACLILVIFKIKASIHMIAVSGFFMFALVVGLHFQININGTIALLIIIMGAVATSRLHVKAHTTYELISGVFIGVFPQLLLYTNWL